MHLRCNERKLRESAATVTQDTHSYILILTQKGITTVQHRSKVSIFNKSNKTFSITITKENGKK